MKKIKIIAVLLSVLMAFSGCDVGKKTSTEGKSYWIATGKNGGTYFTLGSCMAGIWDKYGKVTTNVGSTTGSVENIRLLTQGDMDFGFVQSDILYYALQGKELYDKSEQKGISVVANLYTEAVQVVVPAGSEVDNIAGLAGKIVAVGEYGTATEAAARQILAAYGVSYDMITVKYDTFSEVEEGLSKGTVDAAFAVSALPSANILAYSETNAIKLLPISSQIGSKLKKSCPFFTDGAIKSDVYNTENSVSTLCIDVLLVCRSELPSDDVYNITSALFENMDELVSGHNKGADISAETASQTKIGTMHPGAKKYYSSLSGKTE